MTKTTELLILTTRIFWIMSHTFGIFLAMRLWYREKHGAYLWFAVSWICMALSGYVALHDGMIYHIVLAALRVITSTTGIIALYTLSRLARKRMVTLRTLRDGSIIGIAHHMIEHPDHDTLPPPEF